MNFDSRLYPEGYYVRSSFWKKYKESLPNKLPKDLFQIGLGVSLGDGTLYQTKREGTKLKIEQGYQHKEYVENLLTRFRDWTFYKEPYAYVAKKGVREGKVKSYSFRTFAHPAFDLFWELLMVSGKKTYQSGIITDHLEALGFCYWVADDGSLHKKSNHLILHTQSFSYEENQMMSKELNQKFKLHSMVKPHKEKYWVLYFPPKDSPILRDYLVSLPASIQHKRPKLL